MKKINNTSKNPRVTVVIPTKNRALYLEKTLKTCSAQNYDNLVVIVSDDGSTDHTIDVVLDASKKDSRIRYLKNAMRAGMRDNFEFAINQAESGYLMALGSDDGLMPDGVTGMVDTLNQTGLELLSWAAPLYIYPDVRGPNGQLMLYHPKKDRTVESKEYLARQVKHLNYLGDIEAPMTYVKGIASTNLIRRVQSRSKEGRFYSCPTPDGYSGIVLAGEVERFAFSGKPYAIYGLSPTSQGLNYLTNDKAAKKNSESFFKSVDSIPMNQALASQPYSPLITLMTVDYLLTVKSLVNWPGLVPDIDFKKVIETAINELSHGLYGEDRLLREMKILKNISIHHDLGDHFDFVITKARRKKVKNPFMGTGINLKSIFLDAKKYGIKDIFDAASAACYLGYFYADLMPRNALQTISRSLKYFITASGKGSNFPIIPPELDS
jgi:glycosyltransferase involved in cell wall biosynthesis